MIDQGGVTMPDTYRWPIVLSLVGLILFLMATWTFVQGFGGWHTTFQGPGLVEVEIPAAGDYRLWHEARTIIDGRLHRVDDELPSGATIEFTDARGNTVPVQSVRGSMSQELGNTRRVALGRIEFPAAGTYTASFTGFEKTRQFRLSEIRFLDHLLRALLFAVPAVLLFMTGLIWGIVMAARRRDRQ
jgi:hypothetical protein